MTTKLIKIREWKNQEFKRVTNRLCIPAIACAVSIGVLAYVMDTSGVTYKIVLNLLLVGGCSLAGAIVALSWADKKLGK